MIFFLYFNACMCMAWDVWTQVWYLPRILELELQAGLPWGLWVPPRSSARRVLCSLSSNAFSFKSLSVKLTIYLLCPFNLALNDSTMFQKRNFSKENELPTRRAWKYCVSGPVDAFQSGVSNSLHAVEANLEYRFIIPPKTPTRRTYLSRR